MKKIFSSLSLGLVALVLFANSVSAEKKRTWVKISEDRVLQRDELRGEEGTWEEVTWYETFHTFVDSNSIYRYGDVVTFDWRSLPVDTKGNYQGSLLIHRLCSGSNGFGYISCCYFPLDDGLHC